MVAQRCKDPPSPLSPRYRWEFRKVTLNVLRSLVICPAKYIQHAQVIFARFSVFVSLLTIALRELNNEGKPA